MILIADSGSTKTDWCYGTEIANCKIVQTEGINPFHQPEEKIQSIIIMNFFHNLKLQSNVAQLFIFMVPDVYHQRLKALRGYYKIRFQKLIFL